MFDSEELVSSRLPFQAIAVYDKLRGAKDVLVAVKYLGVLLKRDLCRSMMRGRLCVRGQGSKSEHVYKMVPQTFPERIRTIAYS